MLCEPKPVQYRRNLLVLLLLVVAAGLMALWQKPLPRPVPFAPFKMPEALGGPLQPLPGVKAPNLKRVVKARLQTTRGPLLLEIYPEAAPHAAERFIHLIRLGFYDGTPIFRVVPGFVAQFGINSKMASWKDRNFRDEPSYFRLDIATLAFGKSANNANSTQVFINYGDNSQLVEAGNFTAFAKIVEGYEHTAEFMPIETTADQAALWRDTATYLKGLPEQPDMIVSARILK